MDFCEPDPQNTWTVARAYFFLPLLFAANAKRTVQAYATDYAHVGHACSNLRGHMPKCVLTPLFHLAPATCKRKIVVTDNYTFPLSFSH